MLKTFAALVLIAGVVPARAQWPDPQHSQPYVYRPAPQQPMDVARDQLGRNRQAESLGYIPPPAPRPAPVVCRTFNGQIVCRP